MNSVIHHYFVDEAGDLTLFDKRGRIIVGHEGVSKTFMVGVAHIPNPQDVHAKMASLRNELLKDTYFKNVPSMLPQAKKTAICFHAKNDLPEIRREVFKLLPGFGVKVQVVIRRKVELAREARIAFQSGKKIQADNIYDDLVKRLFRNLLHKADENHIVFAIRGKSERQEALTNAIEKAKLNFQLKWNISKDNQNIISSKYPSESTGLQVIDYYLWALQRFVEKSEDRFLASVWDGFRLIIDLDDKRNQKYGEYYTQNNTLTAEKIMPYAD